MNEIIEELERNEDEPVPDSITIFHPSRILSNMLLTKRITASMKRWSLIMVAIGKPIRWGYKLWVGATRLGYILWFQPYQGQSGHDSSPYKKLGLGASVVLQYSDVLREKIDSQAAFHLFFDNFFTSIPLIDELRVRGIKATGTIRENRLSKCPLPKNKELQKTDRGAFKYMSSRTEEIVVCKWNDNSRNCDF